MIISVANPIYDSVFKFLMEDERIAKTILSALLKKEVLSVEIRRHEHTNTTRDTLSMFRIDFAAKIRERDGKERLILIELQKTWLETETLRFRQYLGAQYLTAENIEKEGENEGYAAPMVAIYLLGHRVGKVDKPVVYVKHNAYDYEGKVLQGAMEDPFIGSLVHDSIIVQIPLLHGQINNHLDKVLSVFDQSYRDKLNRQVIALDETIYEGDDDMMYLLRRLTAATANAELRMDMNVEDEYFSAIEHRDTELMVKTQKLEELDKKLAEKDNQLTEKDNQITEKDNQLTEKDNQLTEKDNQLRSMAQVMLANGMSVEVIAQAMGKSAKEIQDLFEEKV